MSDRLTRFFPLFDAAAILLFALLARVAHRGDRGLTVWTWLDTAWPFLIGVAIAWLAARRVFRGSAQGMGFGGVVWVLAVVTGLGIWWARHATVPHWSFIIVASVTSALLLFGWRLVVRFMH
ncbi:DUF3054 domain-containing protein [Corynebacterium durum]|uniref:DUF3054 domain-containing protein n=1 Tax=Corynebacterium durum TaxID=61592 RepID=UPI0028E6A78A|nr:DUF3054 domain-containing protein [Corynebacterium durum]